MAKYLAYQTQTEMDIETKDGTKHANIGDYIVTDVNGNQYPYTQDEFEKRFCTKC